MIIRAFTVLITILLLFQGFLEKTIGNFTYLDEMTILILGLFDFYYLIIRKRKLKIYKLEILAAICVFGVCVIGIFSNINSNIINIKICFMGLFSTVKIFFVYLLARILFDNINVDNRSLKILYGCVYFFLVLMSALVLLNWKFNFLDTYDYRNGIQTVCLGFNHPSELSYASIGCFTIFLYLNNYFNKEKSGNIFTFIMTAIICFFAGRNISIAFLSITFLVMLIIFIRKKFKLRYIVLGLPVAYIVARDRIFESLINLKEARGALTYTSFKIAKEYFPLGSGFGTFGTNISRIYYSPLYYKYGLNKIWGLSKRYDAFITDTTWPAILAENGVIGLILFFMALVILGIILMKNHEEYFLKYVSVMLIIFAILTGFGDSILFSYRGVSIFYILALFNSLGGKRNYG